MAYTGPTTSNRFFDVPAYNYGTNPGDEHWSVPVNNNAVFLDQILGQTNTISLSSTATVTLANTDTQYMRLLFTGTISTNINIVFPAITGSWIIDNQTTGSFTVTLTSVSGGNTVLAPQGYRITAFSSQAPSYIGMWNANDMPFVIPNSSITNAKLAVMNNGTLKGNISGSSTNPSDLTVTSVLDTISSTQGTILYRNATVWTALATGTSGQFLQTQGSAANPQWATVTSPAITSASGLKVTNNATTPNTQIDITADAASLRSASNLSIYVSSVSVTVNFSTVGANGIDTGSIAASTWYHVYLINNGTTTAGLVSLSATAPTLPSGYTYVMRVGAMRTNASSQLLKTLQYGNRTQYIATGATASTNLPTMASGLASAWTAVSVSNFVPPTAPRIIGIINNANNSSLIQVAPNNSYLTNFSSVNGSALWSNNYGGNGMFDFVLESSNIYWGAQSPQQSIFAFGWIDKVNAS